MRYIIYLKNIRSLFYKLSGAFFLVFGCFATVFSQYSDSTYIRRMADSLTASHFYGRGYVEDGMGKAATFLQKQLHEIGLQVQEQHFGFPVNRFPGKMQVSINGQRLRPGLDFLVKPDSKGVKGKFQLKAIDSSNFWARGLEVELVEKLTWGVALTQSATTSIQVLKTKIAQLPETAEIDIEAEQVPLFEARNVIGVVPGTLQPDSFLVITAHYDHLGKMGDETVFYGANDNASGTAMALALAKRIKEEPLPYTVVFLFFAGEEAGILGSAFFVDQGSMDLEKVRFLLNLDLMGNGEEGVTVVNATEFPREFEMLREINRSGQYLVAINPRGKAANSDHHWFTEAGVPSFFIYTLGERKAYHDVDDVLNTLPLYEAGDIVEMVLTFFRQLSGE